jgi:hypothetical protein
MSIDLHAIYDAVQSPLYNLPEVVQGCEILIIILPVAILAFPTCV